jgi:hypothetical protein
MHAHRFEERGSDVTAKEEKLMRVCATVTIAAGLTLATVIFVVIVRGM